MKAKKQVKPEQKAFADIRELLTHARSLFPSLTRPAANKVTAELLLLHAEIERARSELDPIKDPGSSFDPTNPETAGRLVAMALLAQERIPLGWIARAYGSGVYAIYYTGDHPAYEPVSGTETPLYVGKADPKQVDARTSREQGPQLWGRLADHRRMIKTVGAYALAKGLPNPLRIEDFKCRRLVCATNAQLVAERHLINTFLPVWNNEVGIAQGISKHGDAAKTRQNKRSPWDVIHPGRKWAMDTVEDQMPAPIIFQKLKEHFEVFPPHRDRDGLIRAFLDAFKQHAPTTTPEIAAADDAIDEALEPLRD
jgi:Eco29kI restriction endonuclease